MFSSINWETFWYENPNIKVSYFIILIHVLRIFYYIVKQPTKAQLQLIYRLLRSYMFRHYRVIFSELVFITSPSYVSISIAALGKTFKLIKSLKILKLSNVK